MFTLVGAGLCWFAAIWLRDDLDRVQGWTRESEQPS